MRKIVRLFAVLALVAGFTVAVAAPAQAGNPNTCGVGSLCVYEHTNYDGAKYYWNPRPPEGCYNIGSAWNDRISSIVNDFDRRVWFYTGSYCTGGLQRIAPHEAWSAVWFNDAYSSWRVCRPAGQNCY